jgi:hypothetical protein
MKHSLTKLIAVLLICFSATVFSQNKDIDKGDQTLKKAMEQTDRAKRNELIQKAREQWMSGGLKSPEIAVKLGDAYLEIKDYQAASTSFGSASKEERKVGFKKLAYLQLEEAFASSDPKMEVKTLRSAISFFTKADAYKEGARAAGDKYYDRGADSYGKALEYYIPAEASDKIGKIAEDYLAKGDDIKAAETFMLEKKEEGYKKAGDIYFGKKNYDKAFDAYYAGNITSGLKKYAEQLMAEGKTTEAEQMFGKVADAYLNKEDKASVTKMGEEQVAKSNYGLAATLYDKAGDDLKASKYKAYTQLLSFEFEEAIKLLEANGEASLAKAITSNLKFLTPLANVGYTLDEMKKGAPSIGTVTDANGNKVPEKADVKAFEDYYKNAKGQIFDQCNTLALNISKITDPELKKLMRQKFLQFKAVGNILNAESFAVKIQKAQVSFKDAIL